MIELIEIKANDREIFWNIHQKYLYEMTNYYDDIMDEKGNYQYGYFDTYFKEEQRKAYFIHFNGNLAGFAMINPYSYLGEKPDYVLAEFTIFPIYRRQHIASKVIDTLFKQFVGSWEIKYNEKNLPAMNLWNKACAKYNPKKTRISEFETVLSFAIK